MALRRIAALLLAWCAATWPGSSRLPDAAVRAVERVSADALRGYVGTLAGDDFGGRGVGDPGNRAAEEFICSTLQQNGVTPAGAAGSCYQSVLIYRPSPGAHARLRVTQQDGAPLADVSLGAEAFVTSPQPNRRVIANLNLDMVGRHEEIPDPNNWRFFGLPKVDPATSLNTLHVLGYSLSPELAAELRDANDAVGLTLLEDYDVGAQDLLKCSDHWPFLSHGIPALFLTTGLHPDYHTPDDDTARIDFGKLARVARLAARAAWIVADGPAPAMKKH